ncbi:hypothetical protein D6D54_06855 [Spiroplasma poulsonii]|uniref:Uncharacterized protein n=1 Tax=Spiroplasma poulsonii TaxID=2138 RepID=A0A433EP45_9MOLU|nr:hypothetical protein [Spiroplasma poulsonii]RUP76131.1 hypothetical protein D6D54_06855 [Spiroplasma poulsonii]
MFKWFKRKKKQDIIVNLASASSFDDDIEAASGIDFRESFVASTPTVVVMEDNLEPSIKPNVDQKNVKNIHNLVQNARSQINKYKEENNVNEHENLLERLERLKNLRDSSQSKPSEFQQMLNQIKERNFNDRMAYIMDRIKVSHRDDNKLELNQNGEPKEKTKSKQAKKDNIAITGNKKEITKIKQKLAQEDYAVVKQNNDFTITLSVEQFQHIVRDTVEDVLVDLGIKNKDE